jgi:hypothetical protein
MRSGNTELLPLFPYFGRGAMLPAGGIFRGTPGKEWSQFFHQNTQDEVVVCFGSHGGLLQTGQMFHAPNLHGVNSQLRDAHDPDSFIVVTITQRQSDDGEQHEAKVFRCGQCHHHLLRHEFESTPPDRPTKPYPDFPTLTEGRVAVERLNRDGLLTCPECGYENPPFPLDAWGWGRWAEQNETVNLARRALEARADADLQGD